MATSKDGVEYSRAYASTETPKDERAFNEWWEGTALGPLQGNEMRHSFKAWAYNGWMAHAESVLPKDTEDPQIPCATGGTLPLSELRKSLTGEPE